MKTINFIASLSLLGMLLIGCQQNAEELAQPDTKLKDPRSTIITPDGPMYAGYGYHAKEDRSYKNAIDPYSTFESTDIAEALTVEVNYIETQEQLEKFIARDFNLNVCVGVGCGTDAGGVVENPIQFKLSLDLSRKIEEKTTIDSNHITVIARIKSKSHKYLADKYPYLLSAEYNGRDGQNLERILRANDSRRFIANYGYTYVDSRTVGGEVYYIYTYDYTRASSYTRSEFRATVTANISSNFGLSAGGGITDEEKATISKAQKSAGIVSTIPGFAPVIITEVGQVNGEVAKIQSYLNSNPTKATTIEMSVRPYYIFVEDEYPEFGALLKQEYERWIPNQD